MLEKMLETFHFLQPLWLLALLPLAAIFYLSFQSYTDSRAWEKIIDANLLPLLLQGEDSNKNKLPKILLASVWIVAVIALADPVWEKVPRPIFQTNAARVLVLDLSNSMLIDDLKPSRLARARFKIEDILSREEEGQTGLVLFAGEAFTAAPLTRDTETIRSMLKVLTPQIMPAQGSRADLGLIKAHELLKQAGIVNGQVLLIADGVSQKSASLKAARDLRNDGHQVSVMAVGTNAGGKLNFRNNTSVEVKLEAESLSNIADSGGGNYHLISTSNNDLKRLLSPISDRNVKENIAEGERDENDLQNREWHSTGPFIVLFLLPFAALAFRRGWLLNVAVATFAIGLLLQPQQVIAAESDSQTQLQNGWEILLERLSKNKAQRANNALLSKQYEKARELSNDPLVRGSAEYKLENYADALSNFQESSGADARYNEANTLAKLKKYEAAIAAYDEALKLNPTMQDAIDNKKAVEEFLQKQQSNKNSQASNENQQGNSDSSSEASSDSNGDPSSGSDAQKDQQSGDSQSADTKGEQKQQDAEQQDSGNENQFSEANKDIDKNKKEAEQEKIQAAQNQSAEEQKNGEDQSQDSAAKQAQNKAENQARNADQLEKEAEAMESQNMAKKLAEELTKEEKMAAEQWLRRIPDDPGGLLRRKFRHQYDFNRRNSNSKPSEQPW